MWKCRNRNLLKTTTTTTEVTRNFWLMVYLYKKTLDTTSEKSFTSLVLTNVFKYFATFEQSFE